MKEILKKLNETDSLLTVELDKNDLLKYVEVAEEQLRQNLEVSGFRKGKVPKDQLKKYVKAEQISELALDLALRLSFGKALEEQNLNVIRTADLKVKENAPERLVYEIKITCYPSIKLPDISTIKISRRTVKVEEKEIDETLNSIRNSRAEFSEKPGSAEKGDRVEVDFEVSEDGKVIEGGASRNHPVIIGEGKYLPGFEDKLIGMEKNGEKEFSLSVPSDFAQKNIAGKKLDFKVKVNQVQVVKLPALDSNFVHSLGTFESVEALKSNISEGILEEKKTKEKQRVQMEILDAINNKTNISVPGALLEEQLDNMVADFDNHLHTQGLELGFYLAHIKKTQEELRNDWKKDAEKQVKISLILNEIAKENKLEALEEEIDDGTAAIVDTITARGDLDKINVDMVKLKENVASRIVREKALAWLEKNCSVG